MAGLPQAVGYIYIYMVQIFSKIILYELSGTFDPRPKIPLEHISGGGGWFVDEWSHAFRGKCEEQ